jgi:hypothetical protein
MRNLTRSLLIAALAWSVVCAGWRSAVAGEAERSRTTDTGDEPETSARSSRRSEQVEDRDAPISADHSGVEARTPTVWYGWQIALFDLPVAVLRDQTFHGPALVYYASVPAFWFGGPVIHGVHRHFGRAGVSVALHIGLSILGGIVGCWAGLRKTGPLADTCDESALRLGEAVGSLAATVLDAGLLAYDEGHRDRKMAFAPAVSVSPSGDFVVGWAGRF